MRYVYITLIVIFTAAVLLFVLQNMESVTVVFLASEMKMARGVLILLVYILGMLTGGFVISLVRAMVHGGQKKKEGGKS